jgi:hypothetical protein
MCPTGLCFTPHVHLKKSIDLFGETQAAHALGIETDLSKKTEKLFPTPSSFLRISPIGYFYAKHSYSKRVEIIQDFVKRMFGKSNSLEIFIEYIELLVNSINGLSKEEIIQSIKLKPNSNDSMNQIFFNLIHLLSNDNNNIQQGIQLALQNKQKVNKECKHLNPYDSDINILLTLYLQISAAIYNSIPNDYSNDIYAKNTIEYLVKWIIYQRNQNLHSI